MMQQIDTPDQVQDASVSAQDEQPSTAIENASDTPENRFAHAWEVLFGTRKATVHFPDRELNARVYTMDGETGYRVTEKVIPSRSSAERSAQEAMIADSEKLSFPDKARRGEDHGRSRLKKETVLAIRAWAKESIDLQQIPPWTKKAAELGIAEGTLRDIVARRTWKHC